MADLLLKEPISLCNISGIHGFDQNAMSKEICHIGDTSKIVNEASPHSSNILPLNSEKNF